MLQNTLGQSVSTEIFPNAAPAAHTALFQVKREKKDISSYDLVRHGLKLVLHVLQQRLHLQRSQRSVRVASRRIVPGCVIVIPCVNTRTHVLRQLLHVLRVGAVAHPIAVNVLALVFLLDVGHPRRGLRSGWTGTRGLKGSALHAMDPPERARAMKCNGDVAVYLITSP